MGSLPSLGTAHCVADPVFAAQKKGRDGLNIHLLLPHGLFGRKPGLCGFSGANYLCRVFKKETGQSPAQWRALTGRAAQSGLTPEETMREQEM